MGGSTYSGKGSTSSKRSERPNNRRTSSEERSKSPMVEMLELLAEVEKCRDVVNKKQMDLDSAKNNLKAAEQKVTAQINKLDSATKARLRKMMGGLEDNKEQDDNVK